MRSGKKNANYGGMQVYYFSGTGNAKSVAKWMQAVGDEEGLDTNIQDISLLRGKRVEREAGNILIGFCSPTHGFNFPPVMLKFLWKFPKGSNSVFIMNTRAGLKIGKIHLCGLSGLAQILAALVLKLKGYRIVGMRPVDLPSNWISIHPGLKKRVIDSIYMNCEINVRKFSYRLLTGRVGYRALLDIIQDIAVSPIALAYYFVGRFVLSKTFVASSSCDMCGLCVSSCPVGGIKVIDNRPFWTLKCESCMRCMNSCPKRAIETAHGFAIGFMYLVFTIGIERFYFFTISRTQNEVFLDFFNSGGIRFFMASALAIPFLIFSYRILHFLMRYRFFERIVIYTSLTSFKFWRRYKVH